ncbi:MAG TPA: hypothetical protein VIM16_00125 [Mucilaginibacter sp.]|jgi:hypothetical protein
MTDRELLADANWQAKKEKIIIRDGFKCTACNNFNLVKNCLVGLMFFHGENYDGKLFGFYGYNKKGVLINHKVFIKKYLNILPLNGPNGHVVYIDESSENEIFAKMVAVRNRELTDYNDLVLTTPGESGGQKNYELQTQIFKNYTWKVVPSLLVHRSYYSKTLDPCDYPDSSLQTICPVCLEQLNKKQGVPYLNGHDIPIRTLTPCKKCYGTGYFPRSQEHDEIICNRCNGAMYEEFFYNPAIS